MSMTVSLFPAPRHLVMRVIFNHRQHGIVIYDSVTSITKSRRQLFFHHYRKKSATVCVNDITGDLIIEP